MCAMITWRACYRSCEVPFAFAILNCNFRAVGKAMNLRKVRKDSNEKSILING